MLGSPAAPAQPRSGFDVFWLKLGRIIVKLIAGRSHCDVVITIKDGSVQLVRVNSSYLPNTLPEV